MGYFVGLFFMFRAGIEYGEHGDIDGWMGTFLIFGSMLYSNVIYYCFKVRGWMIIGAWILVVWITIR